MALLSELAIDSVIMTGLYIVPLAGLPLHNYHVYTQTPIVFYAKL